MAVDTVFYFAILAAASFCCIWVWNFDLIELVSATTDGQGLEALGEVAGLLFLPALFVFVMLLVSYLDMLTAIFGPEKEHTGREVFMSFLLIIFVIVVFGKIYSYSGLKHVAGDEELHELDFLYFSVVTWTTLGFGDIVPNDNSKFVVIVQVLLGFIMNSVFVASIITLFGKKNARISGATHAHKNPPQ